MATFEEHIEGLTKIDITSSSTPSQSELTTYLVNGLIDCVNKIIAIKPEELPKFSKTTNAVDSVAKKGRILSVLNSISFPVIIEFLQIISCNTSELLDVNSQISFLISSAFE